MARGRENNVLRMGYLVWSVSGSFDNDCNPAQRECQPSGMWSLRAGHQEHLGGRLFVPHRFEEEGHLVGAVELGGALFGVSADL